MFFDLSDRMKNWKIFSLLLALLWTAQSNAQQTATVVGTVITPDGEPVIGATIQIEGTGLGTSTNEEGDYTVIVPANQDVTLIYSYVGLQQMKRKMRLNTAEIIKLNIEMESLQMDVIEVYDELSRSEVDGLVITPKEIERFPNPSGSLEQMLQYLAPGVSAGPGGELSSQYSVRGGNYDENLVYVNGFEIYRPFLIRNSQQEGLTFPNPNLTRAFTFSTGGFSARYGDKMSSVLDVYYKRPTKFAASAEGSLLGASAHIEGAIKKKGQKSSNPERLSYLFGARYKTTKYLLDSRDLQGEYAPVFVDLQANLSYDINKHWQIEWLGNYNLNKFTLVPRDLSTTTGLFNFAIRLTAVFEGEEVDDFTNYFSGIGLNYTPKENLRFRLMSSVFQTRENERFDIISYYRLEEVQTSLGEDNFGEVIGTLGYGETHQFIRNFLTATVSNTELRGQLDLKNAKLYLDGDKLETRTNDHLLSWGLQYKHEVINDELKEWERVDSLGYTLPYDNGIPSANNNLTFPNVVKTNINLSSNRVAAFFEDSWSLKNAKHNLRVNAGVRATYWDLNKELVFSPRLQIYYSPRRIERDTLDDVDNLTFKLAGGAYYQPPFYRELRNQQGQINTSLRAQKSAHIVAGMVVGFRMFNRPFKFITEGYYKHLWDLVPFDLENVRIRYYGENKADGYVAGIDLRLNGELVKDAESWINLSFLRARERFIDTVHMRRDLGQADGYVVRDVPRPTDQLMIMSMFFQDYLPKAPWAKVNLALTVGTGLPFGTPKGNEVYRNSYRFSAYHRIDIGFSASIWNKALFEKRHPGSQPKAFFKGFQSIWLSAEVFNLMQVSNAASNTWVKDFYNTYYAIPNYLTSRRINIRLRVDF